MRIIKTRFLFFHTLLFILIMLQSCVTVRNIHNDGVDMGFFNGKGEGHVGVSVDINDETAGASGNFMISPAENFLIGAAISTFSYRIFNNGSGEEDDIEFNEDDGQLKGYKFRGNVGYYNNFGRGGKGYVETMLTVGYGSNNLKLVEDDVLNTFETYDYSPFSIGIQAAAGKNMEKVGLMGGIKFQRYLFDKNIPAYREGSDIYFVNGVSFFQFFYGMRFGSGPLKGHMQIGLGINPKDYDEVVMEPIPNFSFGVTYVFGRKPKAAEMSL